MEAVRRKDVKIGVLEKVTITLNVIYLMIPALSVISLTLYSSIVFALDAMLFLKSPKSKNGKSAFAFFFLLMFTAFALASILFSSNITESIKYMIMLLSSVILYSSLKKSTEWIDYFEKNIIAFGVINAILTIYSFFDIVGFINIFGPYMTESAAEFAINSNFLGVSSGILGQTGTNSFCLVMSILLLVNRKFEEKKNLRFFLFAILGYSLLLTGKRGALLWGAIALCYAYILKKRGEKVQSAEKIMKFLCFVAVAFVVGYLLVRYLPQARFVYERFVATDADISSGRFDLFSEALERIKKNPLGMGINAYTSAFEASSHNDYLQLSAEVGIIGAICFFAFFFLEVKRAIKNLGVVEGRQNVVSYIATAVFLLFFATTASPLHHYGMCIQFFMIYAALTAYTDEGEAK